MLSTLLHTNSIFYLYSAAALFFIVTLGVKPYRFSYAVKALPVFLLAVAAGAGMPGARGILLAAAFLCSCTGDIILELDRGKLFVHGLAAFLVAHLFFIPVFYNCPQFTISTSVVMVVLLLYGACLASILLPHLQKELKAPVIAYLIIIMAMGLSAAAGGENHYLVVVGAVLFIVSDSIIAVDKFLFNIRYKDFFIMTTYYLGQLLICIGCVNPVLKTV